MASIKTGTLGPLVAANLPGARIATRNQAIAWSAMGIAGMVGTVAVCVALPMGLIAFAPASAAPLAAGLLEGSQLPCFASLLALAVGVTKHRQANRLGWAMEDVARGAPPVSSVEERLGPHWVGKLLSRRFAPDVPRAVIATAPRKP